jgi:hypothetical protein
MMNINYILKCTFMILIIIMIIINLLIIIFLIEKIDYKYVHFSLYVILFLSIVKD